MKSCIVTVAAKATGAGVQTVTGVVDRQSGEAFAGSLFIPVGNSLLNTLQGAVPSWTGNFSTFWKASAGVDDLTTPSGFAVEEGNRFAAKLVMGGVGPYSILDETADIFFGGYISRKAYVSASRVGEFDITYDANDLTGDSFAVLVLGGDDLAFDIANPNVSPHPCGFEPAGILAVEPGASGAATSPGAGFSWGWAARDSAQAAAAVLCENQGNNYRALSTSKVATNATGSTQRAITAWSDTGYSFTGTGSRNYVAFGGPNIVTAAGVEVAPASIDSLTISTGIKPRLFVLMSTGQGAGAAADTVNSQISFGAYDGTAQMCHWTGESHNGNSQPLLGARKFSNQTVLALVTDVTAGASTVLSTVAEAVSMDYDTGEVELSFTAVDGNTPQFAWFALGEVLPDPGSIIVTKVVDAPEIFAHTMFDFSTNGLTPSTFALRDGSSQTFTGLSAGTYGVQEAASDLWETTYVVSNGDNPDAITLAEGDSVTVTVTNTYIGPAADSPPWKLYRFDLKPRAEQRA